jgi:hypothetical protein
MKHFITSASIALAMMAGAVAAEPVRSAPDVCKKMIADGRGGDFTQKDCVCAYRVAEAVLDKEIQVLLFDSWYNGTDNSAALDAMPKRGRILRQLQTMKRTAEKTCPGFPAG